jgi:chlorophyllide a reductase subunit Z
LDTIPWDDDAVELLDRRVETEPFLVRISAAKRLREQVEIEARAAREGRISAARIAKALNLNRELEPV